PRRTRSRSTARPSGRSPSTSSSGSAPRTRRADCTVEIFRAPSARACAGRRRAPAHLTRVRRSAWLARPPLVPFPRRRMARNLPPEMRPVVAALLFDEPYYIEINEARWAMARPVVERLRPLLPGGLASCADVGSGPGWFAQRLAHLGLTVTGLEGRGDLV